ncbi:MAG: 1-acyl-sn-glycerol-3-phosphate acyltransferase [Smithella sp.]|jgi:1-acyl-sn-glycerol-3-phosphate acyltransferase|nr:1-acyl-sn-glycerol-3-phosphate acyltransferase [Smithella sp.]
MSKLKLIIFVALTFIAVILLWIIAAVCFPRRAEIGPALLQLYGRVCLMIYRVRVEAADPLPVSASKERGIILIANHVSALDIFLMAALYKTVFLSKEEVRRYPLIGWAAATLGTIFIRRDSPQESRQIIREVARLSTGRVITIFPQGTTGSTGDALPFKRGAFKTVELNHGTLLLPVTIRYREDNAVAWRKPQNLLANLKEIARQKSVPVKVKIHQPISIADYTGKTVDDVCRVAQERVFSALHAAY